MSSRLCSYRRQFCFRTSRPLLRPLPALALLVRPRTSPPAPSVTLRVSPPSRRETLTKSQRWLWAEKQRIICFSRGVVQRNKAHVMRLISVLCHAVLDWAAVILCGYLSRNACAYYAAKSAVKTGVCDFGHKSAHAQHAVKSRSVRRYKE